MRIGIYGGSFNPVHYGHKGLVKWVLEHTDLDEVWMLVSPKNPLKAAGGVTGAAAGMAAGEATGAAAGMAAGMAAGGATDATDAAAGGDKSGNMGENKDGEKGDRYNLDTNYGERLAAAREAMKDVQHAVVSDFERNLPIPSYTANTLRELSKKYPEHSFTLIIGEDNREVFDRWREWEYILENYRVMVYPRRKANERSGRVKEGEGAKQSGGVKEGEGMKQGEGEMRSEGAKEGEGAKQSGGAKEGEGMKQGEGEMRSEGTKQSGGAKEGKGMKQGEEEMLSEGEMRSEEKKDELFGKMVYLSDAPMFDISSTEIRESECRK